MNPAKPRNSCRYCGAVMSNRTNRNNVYCNTAHMEAHHKQVQIAEWVSGDLVPLVHRGWMRDYLKEVHDNSCSQCGWSRTNPTTGNVPLEIHHIDGNSQNNRIENLSLLCPNCHSLTETFRGLNRGRSTRHRS